jgi:hypothetical protein
MATLENGPVRPATDGEAMMVATFLSVPLLGLPMMLAICVDFIAGGLARSKTPWLDGITLIGFFLAHLLSLAVLYMFFTAGHVVIWCVVSWLIHYVFCQLALTRKT